MKHLFRDILILYIQLCNDEESCNNTVVYRQSTRCHSGINNPAYVLFMPHSRYNNKKDNSQLNRLDTKTWRNCLFFRNTRVHPSISAVRVVRSLVFCVLLCRPLFLHWLLYCLSCDLWLLNTPLVSSNFLITMYKKSDYPVFSFCLIPTTTSPNDSPDIFTQMFYGWYNIRWVIRVWL